MTAAPRPLAGALRCSEKRPSARAEQPPQNAARSARINIRHRARRIRGGAFAARILTGGGGYDLLASEARLASLIAIANVLQDGTLRARFHSCPMVQAVDQLLQKRVHR